LGRQARETLEPAEERRLLAEARSGDRRALRRLLSGLSGTVYRYGRSFCRNPDDAEDVLQDVLTAMLRSLPRFRGEAALSTWAFVVARRTCARRRRREARFSSLESAAGKRALDHPDPAASPAGDAERRQLGARLEHAIAALPPAQRDVLLLRDVEGRSAAEVARALRLGERAVKSRLHRARLAVREALAPAFAPRGGGPAPGRDCPDTARLLSRYLEGEIDAAVCARMEKHVLGCPSCGAACRTLRAALGECRNWGDAPVPREAREIVRRAIRGVIEESATGRTARARASRAAARG